MGTAFLRNDIGNESHIKKAAGAVLGPRDGNNHIGSAYSHFPDEEMDIQWSKSPSP
jgi:hypothetical protein